MASPHKKHLILLDLFSGTGGFALGLQQAGFKFKKHYFSEVDTHAIANYQYNFKNAIYVGAVQEITKQKIERPDIITFGSPCQNLSTAGKREGLYGEKSRLFFEAIAVIRKFRPRIFIFENVKGLFSSNQGKDFEIVLKTFADLGLYDLQWQLLNTSWFLPQNRERIYLVGSLRKQSRPQVFPIPKNYTAFTKGIKKTISQAHIASTIDTKVGDYGTYAPYVFTIRKRKNTQQIEFRADTNVNCITSAKKSNYIAHPWKPLKTTRTAKGKKIRKANLKKGIDYSPFKEKEFKLSENDTSGALTANGYQENLLTNMESVRRLTPMECERLQGFPDLWTKYGIKNNEKIELSDSKRYQLIGNAVSVAVVKAVGVSILPIFSASKISKTIKTPIQKMDSPLDGLTKTNLKTPITYYGGKQNMAKLIISLIPDHNLYCEPFVGGAAVFFAKPPSPVEVLNDLNGEVVNFYQVCKTAYNKLNKKIQATPHSRKLHAETAQVLKEADQHKPLDRAWAFWVQTNMSFSSKMFGGYAYERKSNSTVKRLFNKKMNFTSEICKRLDFVDLEANDALKVIESRDTKDSFFYIDPPYFNSDMGHYGDYSKTDFLKLLTVLGKIKGKFLLSSYPSAVLDKFTDKFKWTQWSKDSKVAVSKKATKTKTEVLTANYDFTAMMPSGLMGMDNDELLILKAKTIKIKLLMLPEKTM
ncbi:DNA (cytosine-5-)-methyltransferase [Aquimarina agarilytica]|uniref:DNA (cytosine-5-)-methyltransferase n=1 Tax=Aquimarina agarilytica TaxID=1087449 RepID=UPI000288F7F7|nr:DNA (cytosine-5-)-methyltransferase [Aquimarina agarilytica]